MSFDRCPKCHPQSAKEALWTQFIDIQLKTCQIDKADIRSDLNQSLISSIIADSVHFRDKINADQLWLTPSDLNSLHFINNNLRSQMTMLQLPFDSR